MVALFWSRRNLKTPFKISVRILVGDHYKNQNPAGSSLFCCGWSRLLSEPYGQHVFNIIKFEIIQVLREMLLHALSDLSWKGLFKSSVTLPSAKKVLKLYFRALLTLWYCKHSNSSLYQSLKHFICLAFLRGEPHAYACYSEAGHWQQALLNHCPTPMPSGRPALLVRLLDSTPLPLTPPAPSPSPSLSPAGSRATHPAPPSHLEWQHCISSTA